MKTHLATFAQPGSRLAQWIDRDESGAWVVLCDDENAADSLPDVVAICESESEANESAADLNERKPWKQ